MNQAETVANLGEDLGADLDTIGRRLSDFWRSAAQGASEIAAIRACSCNVIALVSDADEAAALPQVLADVSEWHPCRSLVAFQDQDQDETLPPMQGWIRVQCRRQTGSGPQVCSEMITIAVRRGAIAGLADTLISLVVPDLPVYVYWRSPARADWDTVESLSHAANLLIVDSGRAPAFSAAREQLLSVLAGRFGTVEVRDLNWSRLTAWRDLIAQFFDTPAARSLLNNVTELDIRHSLPPGEVPSLALLLAAWLQSRLGWRTISTESTESIRTARMQSASGEVRVRFVPAAATRRPSALQAVMLTVVGGRTFSVVQDIENKCMTATAAGPGSKPLIHIVPCPSTREADLLISELSLPGEDVGFRSALSAAHDLEQRFR